MVAEKLWQFSVIRLYTPKNRRYFQRRPEISWVTSVIKPGCYAVAACDFLAKSPVTHSITVRYTMYRITGVPITKPA